MADEPNVREVIPFLVVASAEESAKFYIDTFGFKMPYSWSPGGKLTWCKLQLAGAAIMMQTRGGGGAPVENCGISVYFICEDALAIYHEAKRKGVEAARPFVGNNMWVVAFTDPDGYSIVFESDTDVAEETQYDPAVHG